MTVTKTKRYCYQGITTLLVGLGAVTGVAAEPKDKTPETPAAPPTRVEKNEELNEQAKEALGWATEFSKEIAIVIEGWLAGNAVTQDRLFAYLYYPITGTDPTKFTTDYDSLADRDFQAINDRYQAKSNLINYAVAMDVNGYVPTHNRQYSQPPTGNRALDLVNNRTKRIFGDSIGFKAARNVKPYLFQSYARDTGETMADMSVPITVRGRHWGCVRIGYRQVEARR